MELPISPEYIYPDLGRINEDGEFTIDEYNDTYEEQKLGVYYDIYCVAIGKKQLAGVDLTTSYGIQHIKNCIKNNTIERKKVEKVIKYINQIKLGCIQWIGEGNYLRNIYYDRRDITGFENAMKLILILHTDYYDMNELEYHISIGFLLGYKPDRIKGFILRNINYREYVISRQELDLYIENTVDFMRNLDFEKHKIVKLFSQIKLICGCVKISEL